MAATLKDMGLLATDPTLTGGTSTGGSSSSTSAGSPSPNNELASDQRTAAYKSKTDPTGATNVVGYDGKVLSNAELAETDPEKQHVTVDPRSGIGKLGGLGQSYGFGRGPVASPSMTIRQ